MAYTIFKKIHSPQRTGMTTVDIVAFDAELLRLVAEWLQRGDDYPEELYNRLCYAIHYRLGHLSDGAYRTPGLLKRILDVMGIFQPPCGKCPNLSRRHKPSHSS